MKKALRFILYAVIALLVIILVALVSMVRRDIPVEKIKEMYTDEASRFVEIEGAAVHYKDEGRGPVLVLLHGTSSSLHTWDGWTKSLKGEYRIVRMDLPAFGITGPNTSGDYTVENYIKFLDAFMQRLGIKKFNLAGNSLGGLIAWRYALARPAKIDKLILVDAAGYPMRGEVFAIKLGRTPGLNRIVRWCTPRFLVEKSIKDAYGDAGKITPELIDRYWNLLLREGNREAYMREVNAKRVDHSARIKTIAVPTLIMWGELDRWIPLEYGRPFHKDIRGSRFILYPGVGHLPMEELPEKSARDARAFLR
jgi:pimeloyl-ACP methyl ester carboxylesterase